MNKIYVRTYQVAFRDRHSVVRVHLRLNDVRFPKPGTYVFQLSIDEEFIADRTLHVGQWEG